MPATSNRKTISRQWELLKTLPSRAPGITAGELQALLEEAGHKVAKRTIERDLVELSGLFPLQCNDKGTPYGWFWMAGSSANLPGITLSEALTLRLVEDSIRPLIPELMLKGLEPRFNQAQQKLQALSEENPSARWVEKVASVHPALNLMAPDIVPEHLEQIQRALLNDLQLTSRYYSAQKNQTREMTLNPLGLVQRGQVSYLIASVEPFDDIRQFALHRFEEVSASETPGRKSADFDLQRYIDSGAMQFGIPRQIRLQAWVDDALARRLGETPLSTDMQLTPQEHGATVEATVNDSWELRWWLLSQAGSIRVQAPAELREVLIERLKQSLLLHEAG